MSAAVRSTPSRTLGRTGVEVEAVSLGGEGVLRTAGRAKDAVPVILEAIRLGVRYCDTAPAYAQSQDYSGPACPEPAVLVEAMRRHPVDSVLCAINPADPQRLPFITTVVAEARKRGVGVVGMKVMAAGQLVSDRAATPRELVEYAASYADTCIIG